MSADGKNESSSSATKEEDVILFNEKNFEGFDKRGYHRLHNVCMQTDAAAVHRELDKGTDINILTKWKPPTTPLIFAVRHSSLEVVQLLISRGANVNYLHPITEAAFRGREDVVKALLAVKADPNPAGSFS